MANITELSLFKACVEHPQHMKLADLNLDRISDPLNSSSISEEEYLQKKTLKLLHMAWSGITKYMK